MQPHNRCDPTLQQWITAPSIVHAACTDFSSMWNSHSRPLGPTRRRKQCPNPSRATPPRGRPIASRRHADAR